MSKFRVLFVLATTAVLGTGCARFSHGTEAGNVLDPADASLTAVLHVENLSASSLELRTILNGQSRFVGSVGANDSTSILLDRSMFPTAFLYVAAIPADGRGRALAGPLAVGKGEKIRFTVEPALDQSHANVIH